MLGYAWALFDSVLLWRVLQKNMVVLTTLMASGVTAWCRGQAWRALIVVAAAVTGFFTPWQLAFNHTADL